jgi:hypothetical protein
MHCARKFERFGPGVLIRPTLRISPISCAASNSESSILTVARRNEAPENDPSSIVARIFCGNLGSGILFLNVRAIFPGSADPATWGVDIEVCDECREVELALIARLARSNVGEGRVSISDLCKELGIERVTLYRYVGTKGELRDYGKRVLGLA